MTPDQILQARTLLLATLASTVQHVTGCRLSPPGGIDPAFPTYFTLYDDEEQIAMRVSILDQAWTPEPVSADGKGEEE